MITSSKTSSAPDAVARRRASPSRKPGAGATRPMLAATGSTMTHATSSSSSGTTLYGATIVSATAAVGHAGRARAGRAWRRRCRPRRAARRRGRGSCRRTSRPSCRPVKPRATRMAVIVASVPLLTQAHLLDSSARARRSPRRAAPRARSARRSEVPSTGRRLHRFDDRRVGVAEDDRAVALHEVDVARALDVPHVARPRRGRRSTACRRRERNARTGEFTPPGITALCARRTAPRWWSRQLSRRSASSRAR